MLFVTIIVNKVTFSNKSNTSNISIHPGNIPVECGTPYLVCLKENEGGVRYLLREIISIVIGNPHTY